MGMSSKRRRWGSSEPPPAAPPAGLLVVRVSNTGGAARDWEFNGNATVTVPNGPSTSLEAENFSSGFSTPDHVTQVTASKIHCHYPVGIKPLAKWRILAQPSNITQVVQFPQLGVTT